MDQKIINKMKSTQIYFPLLLMIIVVVSGNKCDYEQQPTKRDFEIPEFELSQSFPPFPHLQLYLGLLSSMVPGISKYETPIQQRFTNIIDTVLWNCVASFHESHLSRNIGGKHERPVIYHPNSAYYTSESRQICGIYGVASIIPELFHVSDNVKEDFLNSLPAKVLGIKDDDIGFSSSLLECVVDDETCFHNYVECNGNYTPKVIGEVIAYDILMKSKMDGWNADGKIGCTGNCRPYSDYTNYDPYNISEDATCKTATEDGQNACWEPLEEDDSRGFFVKQQHVTPHIGTDAKPVVLTRSEVDDMKAKNPDYKYNEEWKILVNRLQKLSTEQKYEIMFFDNKLRVAMSIFSSIIKKYGPGVTYEKIVWFSLGYTSSEIDATLVVWKEKVRHNLVRPTTYIQNNFPETEMTLFDNQVMKGKDFQPYIRVMPHAEYPSGSACLCQGIKDYVPNALKFLFNDPDLVIEEGELQYENFNVLTERCGTSRLNGGMHFTASVQNAYTLCSGIGTKGLEWSLNLIDGGNEWNTKSPTSLPTQFPAFKCEHMNKKKNICRKHKDICYWKQNKCKTKQCKDIEKKLPCGKINHCRWENDKCVYYSISTPTNAPTFGKATISPSYSPTPKPSVIQCEDVRDYKNCRKKSGRCFWKSDRKLCLPKQCRRIKNKNMCEVTTSCAWENNKCLSSP